MKKPLISLKIIGKNNEKVRSFATRKPKRIYAFLKAGKVKDCMFIVTVQYPNGSTNAGVYQTTQELIHALKAFLESN